MPTLTNKTALIIDDQDASVEVLQRLLKRQDIAVAFMRSGIEATQHLQEVAKPDVIFLDLEMPRSHGYEVLKAIRAIPALHDVPVIAYTTHTSHLNSAKEAGFDGFLGKPLDSRLFGNQIARILNGQAVWEVPG